MADQLQLRGGTTSEHSTFTGALREVTVDTDKDTVVVHDGVTAGGFPLLREDLNNLPAGTIDNADISASAAIAHSKLANLTAGNLLVGNSSNIPTSTAVTGDISIDSTGLTAITAGAIVDADISGSAEISVSKLADGSARQLLQTDSAGTGVEWTSNVDIPGTLDVTSAATFDSTVAVTGLISADGKVSFPLGSATAPSLYPGTDTNTGIYSPAADQLAITTGGTAAVTVDASQRVGIGTTSPSQLLHLNSATAVSTYTLYQNPNTQTYIGANAAGDTIIYNDTAGRSVAFSTAATERARIDSSGRLLVGTSSARTNFNTGAEQSHVQLEGTTFNTSNLSIVRNSADNGTSGLTLGKSRSATVNGNTVVVSGDPLGFINFEGADGTNMVRGASIAAQVDGTPGPNDMPGRLVFSTTADGASSPTERMRITNGGALLIGGTTRRNTVRFVVDADGTNAGATFYQPSTVSYTAIFFQNPNGAIGSISTSGSATAYNTSSDYRLKENVVPLTGAIDRVNQLQPSQFNFIADPSTTVDGFIAHEAQAVVPECVTGEKDAVDDEGNPIYQGIDQSKLVPLLTAALQEAIGRIEILEAEITSLKAQ